MGLINDNRRLKIQTDSDITYYFKEVRLTPYIVSIDVEMGGYLAEGNLLPDGLMTIRLNNDSGIFNPLDKTSPFYDKLTVNTRIRLIVDETIIFSGYIESLTPSIGRNKISTLTCVQGLQKMWNKKSNWEVQQDITSSEMMIHAFDKAEWIPIPASSVLVSDVNALWNNDPDPQTYTATTGNLTSETDAIYYLDYTLAPTGFSFFQFRRNGTGTGATHWRVDYVPDFDFIELRRRNEGVVEYENTFVENQKPRPLILVCKGNTIRLYTNNRIVQEGDATSLFGDVDHLVGVASGGQVTVGYLRDTDFDAYYGDGQIGGANIQNFTINFKASVTSGQRYYSFRDNKLRLVEDDTNIYLQVDRGTGLATEKTFPKVADERYNLRVEGAEIGLFSRGSLVAEVRIFFENEEAGLEYQSDTSGLTNPDDYVLFTAVPINDNNDPVIQSNSVTVSAQYATDIDPTAYHYEYLSDEWKESDDLKKILNDLIEVEQSFGYMDRLGRFVFESFDNFVTGDGLVGSVTEADTINIDTDVVNATFDFGKDLVNEAYVNYYKKYVTNNDLLWESGDGYTEIEANSDEEITVSFDSQEDQISLSALEVYRFLGSGDTSSYTVISGSGAGLSVSLVSYDAKKATLRIINTLGTPVTIDINIRGVSLKSGQELTAIQRDEESIAIYRDRYAYTMSNKLVDSKAQALDIANRHVFRYSYPTSEISSFELVDNTYDNLINYYIGQYKNIKVPSQGFEAVHLITGERHLITNNQIRSTYTLKNTRTISVFVLNASYLGGTDKII